MAYHLRWRRAVIVSFFCHLFFFAGAGYLSAQLLSIPIIPEQYVELDLMNEFQEQGVRDHAETVTPTSSTPPSPSNPSPVRTERTSSTPTPSVSAATMSMITTEAVSLGNTSSTEGATPSSEANTNTSTGSGTKGKSGGLIAPSILSKTDPPYPQSARQKGLEGTVVLKIQILENGRAGNITVSRSSGHEILDDAAIGTVRDWRFAPGKDRDSGQPISCYTTLPISFRLH